MSNQDLPPLIQSNKFKVTLHLYDLSQGLVKQFAPMFGLQIEGMWHTGIVVHNYEYFYGGGIQYGQPGKTIAGSPLRVIDMGYTEIDQSLLHDFLHDISPRFSPDKYSLFHHNCNNFCNEVSLFLVGQPIPGYITGLPQEFLNSPVGQMIQPMISQFEQNIKQRGQYVPWGNDTVVNLPALDFGAKSPSQSQNQHHNQNSNQSPISSSLLSEAKDEPTPAKPLNLDDYSVLLSKQGNPLQLINIIKKYCDEKTLSSKLSPFSIDDLDMVAKYCSEPSIHPVPSFELFDLYSESNDSNFVFINNYVDIKSHTELENLNNLPSNCLFSILALWRLVVVNEDAASVFTDNVDHLQFLVKNIALPYLSESLTNEKFTNLFSCKKTAKALSSQEWMWNIIINCLQSSSSNMLRTTTDLLYNLCLHSPFSEVSLLSELGVQCAARLAELVYDPLFTTNSLNRGLTCLTLLAIRDENCKCLLQALEFNVFNFIQNPVSKNIAQELARILTG